MGKGRKPTPPALRLLEGSRPKNRTKPDELAIICPGVPDAPPHLTGVALDHWNLLAGNLGRAGLLELIDSGSLEAACVAYARAVAADREVEEGGITVMVEGVPRKNPAVTVSRESWETYRHFVLEFGGTPCSRARLKLPTANKQVDEFEDFIKQA